MTRRAYQGVMQDGQGKGMGDGYRYTDRNLQFAA
jgi:hypothetical protein